LRGADQSWLPATSAQQLRDAVHDNLGLETLDVVNFRAPGIASRDGSSIGEAIGTMARLKEEVLIRHIGLSNVDVQQIAEAQQISRIVCVQNQYNLAHRGDEALIDSLAAQGGAYVPFFRWEDSRRCSRMC
jgi:aryl-alcohol dehydrogenase-like predicted oxidoreductase